MRQRETTVETITTTDFDPRTRQLIRQAGQGKIRLTVLEDGEPVAVIMPLASAQAWAIESRRFFDTIREMQETANLTPEEADELAREADQEVMIGESRQG